MTNVAAIGHNNPPDPIDEATAPFADAIAEAENWLDGTKVTNEAQMKAVDAILKDVRAALTAVTKAEKAAAAPLHEAWKAEKARWKPTIDDLGTMKTGLAAVVNDYKVKLAAEREAERRKAEAEAWRKREEAAAAARAADAADIEAQRAAQEKQREAVEAANAAKQVETVKGLRHVWKHEITDMKAALHWIAREDKPAVEAFVIDYVRRHFKDVEIDGVDRRKEREAF